MCRPQCIVYSLCTLCSLFILTFRSYSTVYPQTASMSTAIYSFCCTRVLSKASCCKNPPVSLTCCMSQRRRVKRNTHGQHRWISLPNRSPSELHCKAITRIANTNIAQDITRPLNHHQRVPSEPYKTLGWRRARFGKRACLFLSQLCAAVILYALLLSGVVAWG